MMVDTAGFGGTSIKKDVLVYTNDTNHQIIHLIISGVVEKFATIKPERVFFNGPANKYMSVSVLVIPEEKYPFKIIEVKALNGDNITIKLEKNTGPKFNEYILTVKNMAKVKGKYSDSILIKTDNKIHPEIKIPVLGNIS